MAEFPETAEFPPDARRPIACTGGVLYCLVSEEENGYTVNHLLAYEGGTWTAASDPPVAGSDSPGSCLIPDGTGCLLLSMEDDNAFGETTVLKYAPAADTWEILGVRGFTFGDVAQYSVMTIGDSGDLYLAYQAVGHDNTAAVMSYPLGE